MNSSILLQSVGTDRAESFGNYICSRKGSHSPPHPASTPWRRKNECIEMFLCSVIPLDGVGGASPHQDSHSHQILPGAAPPGRVPALPSHLQACKELTVLLLSKKITQGFGFSLLFNVQCKYVKP